MYIKSYALPVIQAGVYDNKVDEPQQYADRLTEIYTEIQAESGEVIAEHRLSVVVFGGTAAIAYMPVIVVKFPGAVQSVGQD